jgi:hypothetical protein
MPQYNIVMNPLCDLCVAARTSNISTMTPVRAIDIEEKPINGPAYCCEIHVDRLYHPTFGYHSIPGRPAPNAVLPPALAALCDHCPSNRYMFIASAESRSDVALECTACNHQQPFSL